MSKELIDMVHKLKEGLADIAECQCELGLECWRCTLLKEANDVLAKAKEPPSKFGPNGERL